VHTNAAIRWGWKNKARGTVVWYDVRKPESKMAAEILSRNFKELTELPSRGIKSDRIRPRLGMLRMPKIPSVILEIGFHTSELDVNYMNGEGRRHILNAISKSIDDIKRM
jgi:N-acetylmuramoyl-L-alanine amidase